MPLTTYGRKPALRAEIAADAGDAPPYAFGAFDDIDEAVRDGSIRKAADRLIDQYLLLEEASTSRQTLPTKADAQQLLDQVKAQYATETEYRAALARSSISPSCA